MAHPHNEHRQHKVEKSRVHHLTQGYARGGSVHKDEAEDKKLIKKMIGKAMHADGEKSRHRMDRPKRKRADGGRIPSPQQIVASNRSKPVPSAKDSQSAMDAIEAAVQKPMGRAKGGRVKKGNAKTIVNVITGGHPAAGAVPPGPSMVPPTPPMGVAPAGPPPMAAKPPMPMPPPGAGPGMPPGGPPMPMRAKGGRVNQGTAVYEEGKHAGTQVQHSDGKGTANKNLGRGKPITYNRGGKVCRATGGRIESPEGVAKATMLPGGGGGGEARLAKAHREARRH